MSSVGSRTICGTPWSFLILFGAGAAGRKSATAAAITMTSDASERAVTAWRISAALLDVDALDAASPRVGP